MDDAATQAIKQLQRVMEAGFNTLADVIRETRDELKAEIRDTNQRLGRIEDRFDNFLEIAGRETRKLREEVDEMKTRLDRLERRAA